MTVTVRQLAELVQGEVYGDPDTPIAAARSIVEAQPGDITFVENAKHANRLPRSKASAAVVAANFPKNGLPLIHVADPLNAFVAIVRHLHGRPADTAQGIDPRASVHPAATLGEDVGVYPFASVGEGSVVGPRCRIHAGAVVGRFCRLGADVVLHPHVVLYDGTILGDRVIVHANAVIGADGFGYRFQEGRHVKVPQLGHVEIGDDVEIGAGSTIDRGTFQATRVGEGTKIDNLVMIGHNSSVGRHNLFVSQVGMAGSSSTGDYVVLAGQAGVSDHVRIGDRTRVGACSSVLNDLPADQVVLGIPARPLVKQQRIFVTLEKLPEMYRDLRRVKRHIGLNDE